MQSFLQFRRFGQDIQRRVEQAALENEAIVAASQDSNQEPTTKENLSPRSSPLGLVNCQLLESEVGGDQFLLVGFEDGKDPFDPHSWSNVRRVAASCTVTMIGFVVSWASAIDSVALPQAINDFGVNDVVESLATGLYLIAFGFGSLFAGPMSETVGRNPVYLGTMSLYMIFILASGLAPNIESQLIFRFLAGFFGNTPLTCAGGTLADLWTPAERTLIVPFFSIVIFLGAVLAPVAGGWIGESSLSWRWCEWVTLIISGAILAAILFFQPETHAPTLLTWKAQQLRQITGDQRYKASAEISQNTFLRRLRQALYRPFLLLIREPIVILVAIYLVVIYMILFTFLNGFVFIFTDTYGFSEGLTGTAFVAMAVGLCLPALVLPFLSRWTNNAIKQREENGMVPYNLPELRLLFSMIGAPGIPISLFWMGWTNTPGISPWSALGATALFGFSMLCIYIGFYQYVVDSYEGYAASALASVTVIRYVISGAMVPVAFPMYRNLHVHWTLTLFGGLGALLVPVPFVFYRYGAWVRSKSRTVAGKK